MEHSENELGHLTTKNMVVGAYVALLVLTGVMLCLSRLNTAALSVDWLDVHAIKVTLIMLTALVMGVIISMFLMGLRYESKLLNMTIFASNFVFLLIFVLFTWADTSFRGEIDPTFNQHINFVSPVKAEPAGAQGHSVAP